MTALFAVTAAPAPGTCLVRTNNQDAAYTGHQLSVVGQAATAVVINVLRCSRPPPQTAAEANREMARRRRGICGDTAPQPHRPRPSSRLPFPDKDARAQTDGNARVPPSTV